MNASIETQDETQNSGIRGQQGLQPEPPLGPPEVVEQPQKLIKSRGLRAKSAQRLRYEAEVASIKRRLGGLDAMRSRLGLSQRQMAQLLFVDPSAWTRWTKGEEDAPPIVYRALQWLLAVEEKYPALDLQFWIRAAGPTENDATKTMLTEISRLSMEVRRLEAEFQSSRQRAVSHSAVSVVAALALAIAGAILGAAIAIWIPVLANSLLQ